MIGNQVMWFVGMKLDELEKQVIKKAYVHYKTKIATAEALGISVRTLDNKLDRYEEEDKRHEAFLEEQDRKRAEILLRSRGQHPDQQRSPEEILNQQNFPVESHKQKKK